MPLTVINGPFIQAGESLSDVIDLTGGVLVRFTMPGNWTPALLTFQGSSDNDLFNDLYLAPEGTEIRIAVVPGAGYLLDASRWRGAEYLRFRSGTADNPIPQAELREFAVAIEARDATPATAKRKAKPRKPKRKAKLARRGW